MTPLTDTPRRLFRIAETGRVLGGASEATVRRWIKRGLLEAVEVDGVLRVTDEAINAFVAKLEITDVVCAASIPATAPAVQGLISGAPSRS